MVRLCSGQIFSSSNGESRAQSHLDHQGRQAGSDLPQSGQQQPAITSGSRPPTQTHVSGTTRYTFTRPAPVVSGGVREQGRTYTYPFGRANGGGVGVVQPDASGGSDLYRANSNSNNTNGSDLHDRVSDWYQQSSTDNWRPLTTTGWHKHSLTEIIIDTGTETVTDSNWQSSTHAWRLFNFFIH